MEGSNDCIVSLSRWQKLTATRMRKTVVSLSRPGFWRSLSSIVCVVMPAACGSPYHYATGLGTESAAGGGVPLVARACFLQLLETVAGERLRAAQLAGNQADVGKMLHRFHAHEG